MMRKLLLGTTAIIGASILATGGASVLATGQALAAEPPELKISGYIRFEAWFAGQDNPDVGASRADTDATQGDIQSGDASRGYFFDVDDAEIQFRANGVADNGLEYGGKIELDVDGSNTVADEIVVSLGGAWGTIFLGNEDGAEDLVKVAGFSVLSGQGGWDGDLDSIFNFTSSLDSPSNPWDTGDATKITYFTPSFQGFRAGVSWTPDTGDERGDDIGDGGDDFENHIGFGLEHKGNFNDFGWHVSGRGGYAEPEDSTSDAEDLWGWAIGARINYMGWSLAGAYADNDDSGVTKGTSADAGQWWDVALRYSTGPYTIAGGYFRAKQDTTLGNEDEVSVVSVGGNYVVAPGLDLYVEYNYVEDDPGDPGDTENEGHIGVVGTRISF